MRLHGDHLPVRKYRHPADWSAAARGLAASFGAALKRVRRAQGWKQDSFAEALGVSRTTASNIERGLQRIFLDQIYRAASILQVPLTELLPPIEEFGYRVAVRSASDDPVPTAAAEHLEAVLRELSSTSTRVPGPTPRSRRK